MRIEKAFVLCMVCILLIVSLVSAAVYPVYPKGLSKSTSYDYQLKFTSDSACASSKFDSGVFSVTTDVYGWAFKELDIDGMVGMPKYLCEYRDAALRKTHKFPAGIFQHVYAPNISLGSVAGDSTHCPTRPLISEGDVQINVPSDFALINDALCTVPIFLRHEYIIYVNPSTFVASEDVVISGVYGFDVANSEGHTGRIALRGLSGYPQIDSLHISGMRGVANPTIERFNVTSVTPYDDEDVSIGVYGSGEVDITDVYIGGVSTDDAGDVAMGLLSYGSKVKVNGLYFNESNAKYGLVTKQGGDIWVRDDGAHGTVTDSAYYPSIGYIFFGNSTLQGDTNLVKPGTGIAIDSNSLSDVTIRGVHGLTDHIQLLGDRIDLNASEVRVDPYGAGGDTSLVKFSAGRGDVGWDGNSAIQVSAGSGKHIKLIADTVVYQFRSDNIAYLGGQVDTNDTFSVNSTRGYTGSCASGTTLTVSGGIITGCS